MQIAWPLRFSRQRTTPAPLLPEALRRSWDEDGFVILPDFYDNHEIDAAEAALRDAWAGDTPRIVVDDLATGQRLRLADVDAEARRDHRFKINDLYLEKEAIRRLGLNPRISPILAALLGHPPALCNSLNFDQGSAQEDHVDSLFMTPRTAHHLVAIWVALEDCHPDAGPLRYYPGSHKIPQYVFSTGSSHFVPSEMHLWNDYIQAQVKELGLQPQTFSAHKGDVFIWSAYLLHGGSPIANPARTRKSIVFHYFSEEDSVAHRLTLVPEAGGFWIHRSHQPVPGSEPSAAPPLPKGARGRRRWFSHAARPFRNVQP